VWVDVEEFESRCRAGLQAERDGDLDRAVASYELASQLYDGDFLADDPYADWAAATRDAVQLLAMDVQPANRLRTPRGESAQPMRRTGPSTTPTTSVTRPKLRCVSSMTTL
jgi:hypothetical protein